MDLCWHTTQSWLEATLWSCQDDNTSFSTGRLVLAMAVSCSPSSPPSISSNSTGWPLRIQSELCEVSIVRSLGLAQEGFQERTGQGWSSRSSQSGIRSLRTWKSEERTGIILGRIVKVCLSKFSPRLYRKYLFWKVFHPNGYDCKRALHRLGWEIGR